MLVGFPLEGLESQCGGIQPLAWGSDVMLSMCSFSVVTNLSVVMNCLCIHGAQLDSHQLRKATEHLKLAVRTEDTHVQLHLIFIICDYG